ncbi:energy transducer TonB [Mesonia maritima]|uniref:Outer membrane biosynthesis protein TonB n=1 Tax=Mesonia maritima TaxID=1793873 RepID=A0ABU1K8Q5_9FLAO|nr:energy transducer TonB [Mesonia maritima]MDR6301979.1 outer membrane biosynthesis protein TonB [Mesonia maritima]
MKRIVILLLVCFTTITGFSQEIKGNSVSGKEIAPTWPGCENNDAKDVCFKQMLAKHIQQNFKYPADYTKEDKGSKIIVEFIINKEGKAEIKNVSEGRKSLQEAAKKTILNIPEMKAGSLNGKPKAISYKIPFTF